MITRTAIFDNWYTLSPWKTRTKRGRRSDGDCTATRAPGHANNAIPTPPARRATWRKMGTLERDKNEVAG
eukprot:4590409-Lingulodinium_polyedra.AAC.1